MNGRKPLVRMLPGAGLLLLGTILVLCALPDGGAETIVVAQDGNGDYTTITEAVTSASGGDVIRVWEGVYRENADILNEVDLVGNGSHETVIDGEGGWVDRGFYINRQSGVEIRNFGFVNMTKAIVMYGSVLCTISNNTMVGGGITINGEWETSWNSHIIDTSNTVNGRPVHYYSKTDGFTVPAGAGQIILTSCESVIVEEQNCSDVPMGVMVGFSSEITIRNVTASSSNGTGGIHLFYSSDCDVRENTCIVASLSGIHAWHSDRVRIFGNSGDIELSDSTNCTVKNNTLDDSGINVAGNEIEHWNTHVIDNDNTIGDRPAKYIANASGLTVPAGAGQLILANCSDVIVEGQDLQDAAVGVLVGFSSGIMIRDNDISSEHAGGFRSSGVSTHATWGIHLLFSDNCTITNNTCSTNNGVGIEVYESNHTEVTGNNCSDTNQNGLTLLASNHCIIVNNSFDNNTFGIWLQGFPLTSTANDHNEIRNNSCAGDENTGIYVTTSHHATVEGNNCSGSFFGITVSDSNRVSVDSNICIGTWFGIELQQAGDNCTIVNNTLLGNEFDGIAIYFTDGVVIEGNTCSGNIDHGILISGSNDCVFTGNRILGNGLGLRTVSGSTGIEVHRNEIVNNTQSGVDALLNDHMFVNATNNWWGAETGPYHAVNNTAGQGNNVTDFVLFDAWIEDPIDHPPAVEIISVVPTEPTEGETITITVRGTDDGFIVKYVWASDTGINKEGPHPEFMFLGLPAGTHIFMVKALDDAGQWSEEVQTTITVRTPSGNSIPTVVIASPGNDTSVNGIIVIRGIASDADGTVRKVELSLNDGEWESANGTIGWSYRWNTSAIANGQYTIRVRSFDGTKYSPVERIEITVQNEEEGDETWNDDDAGMSTYCWLLVILIIITGIVGYWYLKENEKKPSPDEKE